MTAPKFPGLFLSTAEEQNLEQVIDSLNKATIEWTFRAARGECAWVCSDCGISCPKGMPDECEHGEQRCTDIIKRDKADAYAAIACATGAHP